jgi:hypothetical protein
MVKTASKMAEKTPKSLILFGFDWLFMQGMSSKLRGKSMHGIRLYQGLMRNFTHESEKARVTGFSEYSLWKNVV